jgi:enoyl-CoA hydratase
MADLRSLTEPSGGVSLAVDGALAVMDIDRGVALNAMTVPMLAALAEGYRRIARDPNIYIVLLRSLDAKAFSVGGDMREMTRLARIDLEAARAGLRLEYGLNWLHECFSKPTVSLIDGIVMGSGVGISAYGTHRVAGERYRFAMPETAIGFFPDVGTAHLLARMPSEIGIYLGLTGHAIGRADAYALGLATHCIPARGFAEIASGLARAEPVDPLLDDRHVDPGVGELVRHRDLIAHCFGARTVEEIMARLRAHRGEGAAFAATALADLGKRAPVALKVTLRHIREAKALDLRQTLQVDYRLACRFLESPDVHEGVRAALIDKDQAPRWSPAALADVTAHIIDDAFAPMPGAELHLPLRQEMQALRV